MIHRLLTPQVLLRPAFLDWLVLVCERTGYSVGTAGRIADMCAFPQVQVLLGAERKFPVALLVTQLALQPTMWLGYNEGSKALGAAMMQQASAWVREAGFTEVLMTNTSGRSDAAYERGLRPHGKVIKRATTFLVELNEAEEQCSTKMTGCSSGHLGETQPS